MKLRLITLVIIGTTLTACGGGGGSTAAPAPAPTPAPPVDSAPSLSLVSGTITGFGSVWIDGVRYNTDEADITVGDENGRAMADLHVGMHVDLSYEEGNDSYPTARAVHYDSEYEGPIESIDFDNNTIIVGGQTIVWNDETVFRNITVDELTVGTWIESDGNVDPDGALLATYIKTLPADAGMQIKLTGKITDLDTETKTFALEGVLVDYSGAAVEGELANEVVVKVRGVSGESFVASKVHVRDFDFDDEYVRTKIEGLVSAIDLELSTLSIEGQLFEITESTELVGIDALADVATGQKVKLELDADGVVVKLKMKRSDQYSYNKIKGSVEAIDTDTSSITVFDVDYAITDLTRFDDDDNQYFSFADIAVGDFVELVFEATDAGNVVVRIEVENEEDSHTYRSEVKGLVTEVGEDTVSINGLVINFDEETLFFKDDESFEKAVWLSLIAVEMRIEAKGLYDDAGIFVASKIEIEGDRADSNDNLEKADKHSGYVHKKGTISGVDADARTFLLNDILVKVTDATRLKNLGSQAWFMDGDVVEVEGLWKTDEGTLYIEAKKVELED